MSTEKIKPQVLLLHSQQSILDTLCAGFDEHYAVHVATSGTEALNTLGATPIHVLVSEHNLPGMTGLEALREAKKRSPKTLGILLAGEDAEDGLEALVGAEEVFQIVRGAVSAEGLVKIIDTATRRVKLMTISESANDTAADVDMQAGEHIVMETAENGVPIVTDITGKLRALKQRQVQASATPGGHKVDVLVLTRDEEFLKTIIESSQGLHTVHHANTPARIEAIIREHKVGVLLTDAGMVNAGMEVITDRLREQIPRLVAVVAGRRDDGEMLMDLINRGQVYRFLLKPVSPGRARLAIEASVKRHLDAPDDAFSSKPLPAATPVARRANKLRESARISKLPERAERHASQPVAATNESQDLAAGDYAEPAAAPVPAGADAAPGNSGAAPAHAASALTVMRQPRFFGIAAGITVAVLALVMWQMRAVKEIPQPVIEETATVTGSDTAAPERTESIAEPDLPVTPSVREAEVPADSFAPRVPLYQDLLDQARQARSNGAIIAPPGNNAVELYIATRNLAPDQATVHAEFEQAVSDALGLAEKALLEQRQNDAAAALRMVKMADPENPRITFLEAQLRQIEFRTALEEARIAVRDGRLEDAATTLAAARQVAGAETAELKLLNEELANARSAKRLDEVLAVAGERLAGNQLTSPANDNARYYYELALSNEPGNVAALQGLGIVASKLVLQARGSIDLGALDDAEKFLQDAAAIDPDGSELSATMQILAEARAQQEAVPTQPGATPAALPATGPAAKSQAADGESGTGSAASIGGVKSASISRGSGLPDANSPSTSTGGGASNTTRYIPISSLQRVNYVPPRYPRSAQRRAVTGWVDISFTVTAAGEVTDINIMNAEPGAVFNSSATEAVAQWRFEPPRENGAAVAKRVAVRMLFELE